MQQQIQYSRSQRHQNGRKQTTKQSGSRRIRPLAAVIIILICFLLGGAAGYGTMKHHTGEAVNTSSLSQSEKEAYAKENINILCIGCDQREAEATRADVIMLVTLRMAQKEVALLSIPRDTYVEIAGHGSTKINHALAYGDIALLQQTIETFTGTTIDHTLKVNFNGFINVIDALGGVNIEVEERMYKPTENIDLKAGPQRLDGANALAYVRWRDDGTADIGRINRQQKFLRALVDQLQDMKLSEALKAGDAILDSIETDMSVAAITGYATRYLGMSPDQIETYTLKGDTTMKGGVSYWLADEDALAQTIQDMTYGKTIEQTTPDEQSGQEEAK